MPRETLEQLCVRLQLQHPLAFESKQLKEMRLAPDFRSSTTRCIGTTTRILILALLDALAGDRVGIQVVNNGMVKIVRLQLAQLFYRLSESEEDDPTLSNLVVFPSIGPFPGISPKRDLKEFDRVYQDHLRDCLPDVDIRVTGPLGLAHYYEPRPSEGVFRILDREGRLLSEIPQRGLAALQTKHHTALLELRRGN